MQKPSHIDSDGRLHMVDVSQKAVTARRARAQARVRMSEGAAQALRDATLPKGDAFVAAQLAGVMAAKRTASLIPLAHPIELSSVEVAFSWNEQMLVVEATAVTAARTGVEMEAMVAAAIAALTIYDMTKAIDRSVSVEAVRLLEKSGGKSGTWSAPDIAPR